MKKIFHIQLLSEKTLKKDFYFSSISSIYNHFKPEDIGIAKQTLYQKKLKLGEEIRTKFCVIKKDQIK